MNITKKNFRSKLPELEEIIEKADFFAIDCEFTGISRENNILSYDYPDDAYRKICENTTADYILIQLGLTAVRKVSSPSNSQNEENSDQINDDKFIYRSYNFFVLPRFEKSSFRCQSSSMSFLAENNFDFGLLFREGISYCTKAEERRLRERLQEKQLERSNNKTNPLAEYTHIPVPDDEKATLERISKIIEEFLVSSETTKTIENCNGYQRKLIYQMVESKFPNTISASTTTLDNNVKVLVIARKRSEIEEQLKEDKRVQNELVELEDSIGISLVMQKISKSKKLIVGHNMMLDLMFIIKQFFASLPNDFKTFKKMAHSIFPNVIDTKFMCSSPKLKTQIKSSVLSHVVQAVSEKPFSLPILESESKDYSYSMDKNQSHEAGFDSFLTATAFLGLSKFLNISTELVGNSEIKPFINRIFLMRILDMNHINLVGNEPSPNRDHVFHITFPEIWKQTEIVHYFRNFGPIFISWIDSTSALVSLHNRENAPAVLKMHSKLECCEVQSLASFKKSLDQRLQSHERNTLMQKRQHGCQSTSFEQGGSEAKKLKVAHKEEHIKEAKKTFNEDNDWT